MPPTSAPQGPKFVVSQKHLLSISQEPEMLLPPCATATSQGPLVILLQRISRQRCYSWGPRGCVLDRNHKMELVTAAPAPPHTCLFLTPSHPTGSCFSPFPANGEGGATRGQGGGTVVIINSVWPLKSQSESQIPEVLLCRLLPFSDPPP